MRLGVEPAAVATAAGTLRGVAAQLAGLDVAGVGATIAAGMPGSSSARIGVAAAGRLADELSALAQELAAHADRLLLAAEEYAAAEQAVATGIGHPS